MNEVLMNFVSLFLQNVLLAFASLAASFVAAWLLAKVKSVWADLREKLSVQQADFLKQAALFAVQAAEQAGMGGLIKDKKTYAVEVAQIWLANKGLTIDLELIAAAIEAAVLEQFNKDKVQ